jgi:hypothetical protein
MKTQPLKKIHQMELYPTAGFGSKAPTWIKADLLQQSQPSVPQSTPQKAPWYWLRRQLGWQ